MSLSSADIDEVLLSKLKNRDYVFISSEIAPLGDTHIGYLSSQYRMIVRYMVENRLEELRLFVKRLPDSKYHCDVIISTGAFRKEVMVFEKFLKGLKEKIGSNVVPTYYLGRPDDLLVLQDLTHEGFKNVPLLETYTLRHCEKMLLSLAKIHAASLKTEIEIGCRMDEYIEMLTSETIYSQDKNNIASKAVAVGLVVMKALHDKYLSHYPKEVRDKAHGYMVNLSKTLSFPENKKKVLTHGDLWASNIMFRYDENGQVEEACLIDFQLAHYRPLTFDFQMFLHLCTDKKLRDQHYDYLSSYYYDNLIKESTDDIDLSRVISWSEFESSFNETLPVVLAIAPQYLHFILMPDNIIRDVLKDEDKWKHYYEVDRVEYAFRAAEENTEYRYRVVEALAELHEYFKDK